MKTKALGLIETMGYIPAVEAADAGVKSANVSLLSCEITSALITVVFEGDVGAVRAAVSAAYTAASKVGKVVGGHVISRPSDGFHGFQKGTAFPLAAGNNAIAESEKRAEVQPAKTVPNKASVSSGQKKGKPSGGKQERSGKGKVAIMSKGKKTPIETKKTTNEETSVPVKRTKSKKAERPTELGKPEKK